MVSGPGQFAAVFPLHFFEPCHGTRLALLGSFFFGFAEWLAEGNRLRCFDYQGLFDPDLLRSSGEI